MLLLSLATYPPLYGYSRTTYILALLWYLALMVIVCWLLTTLADQKLPSKPFGTTRKRMALLAIAIGLGSFFVPLVILRTPVMGRTQWSAWNFVSEIYLAKVPALASVFNPSLIEIELTYLLIVFALIAVASSRSQNAILAIAAIGTVVGGLAVKWGLSDFSRMFSRDSSAYWDGAVRFGPAMYVLPAVMPVLLLISLTKGMDLD